MLLPALGVLGILLVPGPGQWRLRYRKRRPGPALLPAAIHAELSAGGSLRQAIATAGIGRPDLATVRRLAMAGAPMAMVADALGPDRRLGASVEVAARSGGRAAAVFQRLADRAAADADLMRQQRVLTTQARLSAAIVAGIPVVWMMFGGAGRIRSLVAGGAGIVAVIGLAMEIGGVALVWRLASS
jgi:Flp pilus assembly protein TadB